MVIEMKNKNNIFFYVMMVILVILGAFFIYSLSSKSQEESKLISITVDDLETKINNKESFVLVLTQTGCSHCEQYLPELKLALNEVNLHAYTLNITDLNQTQNETLESYVRFGGTPTTVFFKDGTEKTSLNRIVGYASKAKIIERLKSLGYVD